MEADFDRGEFEEIREAEPSATRVQAIRSRIVAELSPVKPFPSDRAFIVVLVTGFICFGVACAIPLGLKGFHAMTTGQRLADYFVILSCAPILAQVLTAAIIPGSRRRLSPALGGVTVFAVAIAVTALLFPDYSTAQFIRKGVPCLTIGTAVAILAGAPLWRVVRLGMLTDRLSGIVTAAMLSGMVGVFTLALHCPILNAAHILAWHIGVPALSVAVGVLVTRIIERRLISGS